MSAVGGLSRALGPLRVWVGRDPGDPARLGTLLDDGCSSTSSVIRTNLIPDPRYIGTDGITGTTTAGAYTQQDIATGADDGRGYTRFTAPGDASTDINVGQDELVPVTAGATYTGSLYVRLPANVSVWCRLMWKDVDGATISNTNVSAGSYGARSWRRISATGAAPAGAVSVAVIMWIRLSDGPPDIMAGDTFDVGMRMLEAGSVLGTYFDGGSTSSSSYQYTWLGPADASASTETAGASPLFSVNEDLKLSWGRDDPLSHPDAGSVSFTVDVAGDDMTYTETLRVGQHVELQQDVYAPSPYWGSGGSYATAPPTSGATYGVFYQDTSTPAGGYAQLRTTVNTADPDRSRYLVFNTNEGAISRAYITPRWLNVPDESQLYPAPTVKAGDVIDYAVRYRTDRAGGFDASSSNLGIGVGITYGTSGLSAISSEWHRPLDTGDIDDHPVNADWPVVRGRVTAPRDGTVVILLQKDASADTGGDEPALHVASVDLLVNGYSWGPDESAAQHASVFVGNITDSVARRVQLLSGDVTRVDITASEWMTQLARMPFACEPQLAQTVSQRLSFVNNQLTLPSTWRYSGLTGAGADSTVQLAGLWDIDNQPALDVLRDVAINGVATVWPVSSIPTGNGFDRPAILSLYVEALRERYAKLTSPYIELDACTVDFEIEWTQSQADFITAMQVAWKLETTDDDGDPVLEDQTELYVETDRETEMVGRNAATVSSFLPSAASARQLASSWLTYVGGVSSWRCRAMSFATDDISTDPATAHRYLMAGNNAQNLLFGLLDASRRRALNLRMRNLPAWVPVRRWGEASYAGFLAMALAGMSATYTGQWLFELTVDNAEGDD